MIYEIRLRGRAKRTIAHAFDDFDVWTEPGITVLRAEIPDQPALHGVIDRVRSLGLELLELRRVEFGSVIDPNSSE